MKTTNAIDAARVALLLAELRLPAVKLVWADLAAQADKEGWPAARFLDALAEHEITERGRRRIERHLAEARLPPGKTIDTFDFEAVPVVSKAQIMALAAGDADRRRRRAPSNRGPRGDQPGARPQPTTAHGAQGAGSNGEQGDHGPGRPRLLQRRPGSVVRRHGRRAYRAQDPDVERDQTRLVHTAGLHLRRRARPLHLPGGRKAHQNPSPRGSHRRLRPLPPPERLRHLSAQTPVHADPAADHQTLGE